MNVRDYIREQVLLTDGAMGTYFDQIEKENYLCSEEANLVNPDLIIRIHLDYIRSGARLIRTNTFSANDDVVEKLRVKYPEACADLTIQDLVKQGYALGQKAAKIASEECGAEVYVAADIGPVIEETESEDADQLRQYYEMCDGFLEAGAEVFVFETFPDEKYVLKMAEYVRNKKADAFLIGQFSFVPTGYSRTSYHFKSVLEKAAGSGLLDAVGFNCGVGAAHMKRFIIKLLSEYEIPANVVLTALPNCGYPQIIRGRAVYSDSKDYFANTIMELLDLGVGIVGGCCGTDPAYIGEIANQIVERKKGYIRIYPVKPHVYKAQDQKLSKPQVVNTFRQKVLAGEKVYAVELDPPYDNDTYKFLDGADALVNTKADIITIADSPLARSRADSFLMAAKIKQKTGMDVMPHLCCRDRNRIALRSSILGVHINEIRNMLIITGDPVDKEARSFTKSVFEFNSIKLMEFIKGMNEELFMEEPIFYGGAINQNGANLDAIAGRMEKKMEAGCAYFLTQPVYSEEDVDRIAYLRDKTGARILLGIMPLVSYRNAMFIKNEMPGIHVSDEIMAQYHPDGNRQSWEETAISISKKIMKYGEDVGAGYYMMTPFNRVSLIKEIIR